MEFKHLISIFSTDGVITADQKKELEAHYKASPFSIHWEFRILLYLAVMLFATGIGFLVYLNIDTIGHTFLIGLTGLACAACFYFVWKNAQAFSWSETKNDSPFTDYLLLLACLLFLTFEGYLQFQYQVFGERYGVATLIPSLLFLVLAYRFDHKGVLSMGITGLAGWLGISTAPNEIFDIDFENGFTLVISLLYGAILATAAYFSKLKNKKPHYFFTYFNFGTNLLFIGSLAGIFIGEIYLVYALLLAVLTFMVIRYARHEQSNYFFLIACLYGYIGASTVYFKVLWDIEPSGDSVLWFGFLYFIGSCGAIIFFILNFKKMLTQK